MLAKKHNTKVITIKKKLFPNKSHKAKNVFTEKSKVEKTENRIRYYNTELAKVDLTNYGDIQYWGKLGFKSDQGHKDFNVLFDTGSSWVWLPSNECESCAKYNIKAFYTSNTKSKSKGIYTIHYGKGSVEGDIIQDSFTVDGKEIGGQYFLDIKKMKDMPILMFDGLVGLGPKHHLDDDVALRKRITKRIMDQIRKQQENDEAVGDSERKGGKPNKQGKVKVKTPESKEIEVERKMKHLNLVEKGRNDGEEEEEHLSFLINLKKKNVIKDPVFSVYLSSKEKKHKNPPSIIFGGYLTELMDGDFKFCDSNADKGHWAAELTGFKMINREGGEGDVSLDKLHSNKVLIDSGTSMLTMPKNDFTQFMEKLKVIDPKAEFRDDIKEIYLPNINDDSQLPNLSYSICGNEFILEPEDYAYGAFEDENKKPVRVGSFMKISELNLNEEITILGDPFLQKYYVLFDATDGAQKIGIVKAKHPKISNSNSNSKGEVVQEGDFEKEHEADIEQEPIDKEAKEEDKKRLKVSMASDYNEVEANKKRKINYHKI